MTVVCHTTVIYMYSNHSLAVVTPQHYTEWQWLWQLFIPWTEQHDFNKDSKSHSQVAVLNQVVQLSPTSNNYVPPQWCQTLFTNKETYQFSMSSFFVLPLGMSGQGPQSITMHLHPFIISGIPSLKVNQCCQIFLIDLNNTSGIPVQKIFDRTLK